MKSIFRIMQSLAAMNFFSRSRFLQVKKLSRFICSNFDNISTNSETLSSNCFKLPENITKIEFWRVKHSFLALFIISKCSLFNKWVLIEWSHGICSKISKIETFLLWCSKNDWMSLCWSKISFLRLSLVSRANFEKRWSFIYYT